MASRKDFEAVARILKDNVYDPSLRAVLALEFVEYFKANSRSFDTDRFIAATKRNTGMKHHYPSGLVVVD